ncbi:T9SS type A sorting domain-containing protein [Taibaiella soli]|uniref:Secretion system C-terminal sorting domain-containing protein n=1 Tax=Taibaiella soli TaxID=1649169 RepID=A0A2W2AJG0_9BACT|nr:T9SS type A sorting domain-containing protein [Taibaiella soli]PZF73652.1 hypothetical protein DN068_06545 [Taibaiella soli]
MKKCYALLFTLLVGAVMSKAQISIIGSLPFTYTQDFNTYNGAAATSAPAGWTTTSNVYKGYGTGSSNAGGIYALGTSPDYAMGALCSGSASTITFKVSFTNNTTTTITSLDIAYDFEQWRWATGNSNPLTVTQTGLGSASVSGLTQASSSASGPTGTGVTTHKSISLSGLSVAPAATFSLTWTITDGSGSDNAVGVDNFVITADGNTPPASITQQPVTANVCGSATSSFSVTATNAASYQWQEFINSWTNITNNTVFTGATTNALAIANTSGLDGHAYRCVVTGATNQVNSDSVLLHVAVPIAIAQQPTDAIVCAGNDTAFHVTATGSVQGYQWQVNSGTGYTNITTQFPYSGGATNSLSLSAPAISNLGNLYRCIVTGACGNPDTTQPVKLMIHNNPVAHVTPTTVAAFCAGDSAVLKVDTAGIASYQWLQGTSPLPGANGKSYKATTTGLYTVTVTDTNHCAATSVMVPVTVNALPTASITPNGSLSICQGSSVVLNANTGTGLSYQWQENGGNVAGATNASYNANHNSSYTVIITDSNACMKTATAQTVSLIPFPSAAITVTGATTICQGNTVVLTGTAGAGLSYQWLLNGNPVSGATSQAYTATQAGDYKVAIASNSGACADTSTLKTVAILAIPTAPLTAAAATTFCAGDSVWLHTTNAAGLNYQWQLNGNNIPGAHDSLFKATADGIYAVVVTNAASCSTTSANMTVTVHPGPGAVITYNSPLVFCEGGAVVLNSSVSSGLIYQWSKNNTSITGASTNSYIASETGAYTLKTTTSFGCSAVSGPMNILVHAKPQPVVTRNADQFSTTSFASYQWYLNSQPISGGTSKTVTATQNGSYSVEVVDSNGCQNRSTGVFINNLAVTNINAVAGTIKMYPNPATDRVMIDTPFPVDMIIVKDMQGKTLIQVTNSNTFDVSSLSAGLYLVTIYNDGAPIAVEKLIKSAN